jgi:hypothetical protein
VICFAQSTSNIFHLAIYSALTFYKTGPLIYGNLWEGFTKRGSGIGGFRWKYCDAGSEMTDDLMPWAYIFYLSKYWEVLGEILRIFKTKIALLFDRFHGSDDVIFLLTDTVIILVKGKKASTLQEYQ